MTPDDPLAAAWALLGDERARFDAALLDALHPQRRYLSDVEYRVYRGGKKLRPLLLLLAARMCGDDAAPLPIKAIQAAVSLEMLHTATLIHDDIIDGAAQRRGAPSTAAARGTKTAILIGDLQFVQAIRVFAASVDTQQDMQLVNHVLDVGFKLCCGELDELDVDPTRAPDDLRMRYFRTIDRKTATLFGFACEAGATLAGAPQRGVAALSQFGWNLGRAFQIMDDVLDFLHPAALAGKAAHADLLARRLTLPIIFALAEFDADHIVPQVVRGARDDAAAIAAAARAIADSKGLMRAYALARSYTILAIGQLNLIAPSRYRDAAEAIAYHIVNRRFLGAADPAAADRAVA
ncbi:MAG: polyprenyl synthetase family protein [Sphingomonas sp.]|nr:polyprenyl synthetase family protein [Sphingomonas sp.]